MTSHVSYGQFGPAQYSHEEQAWSFLRDGSKRHFSHLPGHDRQLLAACLDRDDGEAHASPTTLIKRFPELQPASSELLHQLARESVAAKRAEGSPNDRGDVLAFGRVAHAKSSLHNKISGHTVSVLALPCGHSGEVLRLIRTETKQEKVTSQPGTYVDTTHLTEEVGYWVGGNEPILQLVFANSTRSRGALVAARLRSRTLIFRPVWHQIRKPPVGAYAGCSYPSSHIEVCPLIAISNAQTGGAAHADVCFDPLDQRRFAVVDVFGRWTAFRIAGRHAETHVMYHVDLMASGDAFSAGSDIVGSQPEESVDVVTNPEISTYSASRDHALAKRPGWVRCSFHLHGLLVFTRHNIQVFALRGGNRSLTLQLSELQVGWDELLDAIVIPERNWEVCLLSSTRVLCASLSHENNKLNAKIVVSWPPYRNQDDRGLRLSQTCLGTSEVGLLVHSNRNTNATLFWTHHDPGSPEADTYEPVRLSLPLNTTKVYLEQHDFKGQTGARYPERLTSVVVLQEDLSLSVQYYHATIDTPISNPSTVQFARPKGKELRSFLSDAVILRDDFIVPDATQKTHSEENSIVLPGPKTWGSIWASRRKDMVSYVSRKILNHHFAYLSLVRGVQHDRGTQDKIQHRLLNIMQNLDYDGNEQITSHGTLLDLANEALSISDIEGFSMSLSELAESSHILTLLSWAGNIFPRVQRARDGNGDAKTSPAILTLYDGIVSAWISKLPRSRPIRIRLAMSQLASRIAGEVGLASLLVRQKLDEHLSAAAEPSLSKAREPELYSESESQRSVSMYDSSYADTPDISNFGDDTGNMLTPELTPSIISGSSYNSRVLNPSDMAFERLRRLANFSERPAQAQPRIRRILDHWEVGTDPQAYDWAETRRSIENKGERTLNKKAERRARRHLEKQRREAARAGKQVDRPLSASQPAPRALPIRSSPPRPPGVQQSTQPVAASGLGFSQSQAGPAVTTSQVTRGRHGARPRPPPLKKRRQGF